MYKKMLIAAIVAFTCTQVYAGPNYTLQATPGNIKVKTPTYTSQPTNGFSEAFEKGLSDAMSPSNKGSRIALASAGTRSFDPYMIEIDGTRYMLFKDNNDGKFDKDDILGYKDTKENIFASLKPLDTNYDKKLTGDELSKAGIRLVKISPSGKLMYSDKNSDFNNSDIKFIYIKELRKSYTNNGSTGNFGLFDVVIKKQDKSKIVTGIVTFETEKELEKYF